MSVLVVGHTGYVGRSLIRWFSQRGTPTAGLSRGLLAPAESFRCESQFRLDDLETDDFLTYLNDRVTSVVLLSADTRKAVAPSDVPPMVLANAALPAQVTMLAAEAGVPRVVFASTYSVNIHGNAYSPQSFYAATKKSAEDLLEFLATTTETAITALRFYDIYGPGQPHDRFIPYLVDRIRLGAPISMTRGLQEVSPIFIDDVCSVLAHCLADAEGSPGFRVRSAHGPECVMVRELPGIVANAGRLPLPPIAHDRPERPREVAAFLPSHPLPLGWSPATDLHAGLTRVWGNSGDEAL